MPTKRSFRGQARRLVRILPTVLLAFLAGSHSMQAAGNEDQEKQAKNPFAGDAEAIKEGESIFRVNCGYCHGFDARGGGKGPDLTSGRWTHGDTDAAIFRTITQGAPGTEMPANDLPEEETWKVVAYLRNLVAKPRVPLTGNREIGEKIFFGKGICSQCHMVNGKGGRLGPDLSSVGASRSTRYLIDAIRDPSKDLAEGMMEPGKDFGFPVVYDTVTAVTKDGRHITGVAKNEDTFSLQLMDGDEQLHLLLKMDLQEVVHERKSLMPAYSEEILSENELQDLLGYLDSLRGR